MHDAFILAAGLGTRLRPLTVHRPKPLVPICGVPLLAYQLALCAEHGLTRVLVNAHWLAEQISRWEGLHEGCNVSISVERPEILGTGGGLRRVEDRLAERFVVLNGDVLHQVDLRALLEAVPAGGAAMALRPDPANAPSYGIVAADATETVVRLRELASASPEGAVAQDTHFTGIHAMHRDSLRYVPDGYACVVRSAYLELVPARRVRAVRYEGPWLDAGDPSAYLQANMDVLHGRIALALDPMARAGVSVDAEGRVRGDRSLIEGAEVRGPVWVGPGAQIGRGARLDRAVIGAGARVAAGATLVGSVIWDEAEVGAEGLTGGIAHDGGFWVPEPGTD